MMLPTRATRVARNSIATARGGLAPACERVAMASVAAPADLLDVTTTDALQEKKKLRKHFARFDIVFFLICTLVGVDTLGAVASNGPQAFTWLIFLAILFFVPYALLTAELGSAFPEEGGPYIWTRLAFGRRVAAVNGLIYWVSNPIWVGGTLGITALWPSRPSSTRETRCRVPRSWAARPFLTCCSCWHSSGSRWLRRSSPSASGSGCRRSERSCGRCCSASSRSPW